MPAYFYEVALVEGPSGCWKVLLFVYFYSNLGVLSSNVLSTITSEILCGKLSWTCIMLYSVCADELYSLLSSMCRII